jgi:hypothetical protein
MASGFVAWLGRVVLIMAPVPQSFTRCAILSSISFDNIASTAKPPNRISRDTRSGHVAANNALIVQPSENPMTTARFELTVSMTARTSSIRSSSEGAPEIRSDNPWPLLSKVTTRVNAERRRRNAVYPGDSCRNSMCDTTPGTMMISTGPSPII